MAQRRIFTISEITANIKALLEDRFPFIWICGEISNIRIPASGHFYFTLKDKKAQISTVMFRGQNRNLKFMPEDGMSVTGIGRISVYEARGTYQIILEYLEPEGRGAIQLAFEQLKKRLKAEGLFDEKHKKPLPFLPRKISIVTSPAGAVVHDILKIVNRRFPNIHIEIIPVKVQGDGSEMEIVLGLEVINERSDSDLVILARGGGSLEDLHAFNSEDVARAIFASKIPIISAVGHETDFSIADFVADLRAPTPSAAAELAVPLKIDLLKKNTELKTTLIIRFSRYIEHLRTIVKEMSNRLVDPNKRIEDLRLRTDDLLSRLIRTFRKIILQKHERLEWRFDSLNSHNPLIHTKKVNEKLEQNYNNLLTYIRILINNKQFLLREFNARLNALSPNAILARGYSITRSIPDGGIVRNPIQVEIGQDLKVILAKGSLICRVKRK
ncbi:MAG: exodeoxyribonuclease VII large subunit [Deltaproteobacteria bacterium]|nr:MAG: exodeoxyribonuclease VII large subunit [Deltaproteobacteria bacterium]